VNLQYLAVLKYINKKGLNSVSSSFYQPTNLKDVYLLKVHMHVTADHYKENRGIYTG